jgi:membrane dipeptidase
MRLIDLHCDWLSQYAPETTGSDPTISAEVAGRLGRLDGYLLGVSAAILTCARTADDWARQADAWRCLGAMLTRYEAEFAGRLLVDAADVARWRAEPADGLAWGLLAVAGCDFLVREPRDLDRLPALLDRGVRAIQLVAGRASLLAGSDEPGDERGLTELGRGVLARLEEWPRDRPSGPRPIVDLAGLNERSVADVLQWWETNAAGRGHLPLVSSHGGRNPPSAAASAGLTPSNLGRFRALGGVIGLSPDAACYRSPVELKAVIEGLAQVPFEGRFGYEGIAIATDFLGIDQPVFGLANVRGMTRWIGRTFDRPTAASLIAGNGRRLLLRSAGVVGESEGRPG